MALQPNKTSTRDPMEDLRSGEFQEAGIDSRHQMILPDKQGDTSINIFGSVMTAQKIVEKRVFKDVLRRMADLSVVGGKNWVYSWKVRNNKEDRMDTISGGTIKLANDMAREWGNCLVDIRVHDHGTHWTFYGRFVDLETGYTLTRPYEMGKDMNIGKKYDAQRARDMKFSIGASKCIRNVVLNALQTLTDHCLELAENKIRAWVDNDPEAARAWILRNLERLSVPLADVERAMGLMAKNWTNAAMAEIRNGIQSVGDGAEDIADLWPSDEVLKQRAEDAKHIEDQSAGITGAQNAAAQQEPPGKPPIEGNTASTEQDGSRDPVVRGEPAVAAAPEPGAGPYSIKSENGSPMGRMDEAPELGSIIDLNGVDVRVVEVTEDPRVVVVKVQPPPPKKTAADKAKAAADKATAKTPPLKQEPPAQQEPGKKLNIFGDE